MCKFAGDYKDFEFVQTVSAQITWSHNIEMMNKITSFVINIIQKLQLRILSIEELEKRMTYFHSELCTDEKDDEENQQMLNSL